MIISVITSYSIHYTKLYEVGSTGSDESFLHELNAITKPRANINALLNFIVVFILFSKKLELLFRSYNFV